MTTTTEFDHYKSDAETPLSTQGAQRLLKLANFLAELPRQKFDFGVFFTQGEKPPLEALKAGAHRCGTVGCAIGWMPAIWPRLVKWGVEKRHDDDDKAYAVAGMPELLDGTCGFELAEEFFGISWSDSNFLFNPGWYEFASKRSNPFDQYATPKQVARHIRKFVKRNYVGRATLDI